MIRQVAHEELVATHRLIHGDLEGLHSRFEEQRSLNDRLENDLLRINQSTDSGRASGTATPSGDPLAGMNLGRKVRRSLLWLGMELIERYRRSTLSSRRRRIARRRRPSFPSSLRNEIDSDNETLNWKRCASPSLIPLRLTL